MILYLSKGRTAVLMKLSPTTQLMQNTTVLTIIPWSPWNEATYFQSSALSLVRPGHVALENVSSEADQVHS